MEFVAIKCGACKAHDAIAQCEWQTRPFVRVGSEHNLPLCASCVRGGELRDFLLLRALSSDRSEAAYAALPSFVENYFHRRRNHSHLCDFHFNLAFHQHVNGLVVGGETR